MSKWWSRVLSGVELVAVGGSNVLLFVVWWILYWQFYQFTSVKITDLGRFPCKYQTCFRGPHSRIGLYVNWNKSFLTFPVQIFAISFFTSEKTPLLMAQLHDIRNILRKTVPKTLETKPLSLYPEILGVELGWNNFEYRHLFEDFLFVPYVMKSPTSTIQIKVFGWSKFNEIRSQFCRSHSDLTWLLLVCTSCIIFCSNDRSVNEQTCMPYGLGKQSGLYGSVLRHLQFLTVPTSASRLFKLDHVYRWVCSCIVCST